MPYEEWYPIFDTLQERPGPSARDGQRQLVPQPLRYICMLSFFFFQAEDGIRDLTVTGVQTCALPISTCCAASTGRVSTSGSATRLRAPTPRPTRGSSCSICGSSCAAPWRARTSSSPRSSATASGCSNDRSVASPRRRDRLAPRFWPEGEHRAVDPHPLGRKPGRPRVWATGRRRRSSRRAHARERGGGGERPVGRSGDVPARPARASRAAVAARAAPGQQGAGGAGPRVAAAARCGPVAAGGGGGHGQRGGPPAIARNALGIRARGGVCRSGGGRCRFGASLTLRVSSGIWLSYLLSDERRNGAPRERTHPLAGPRFDQGDREGTARAGPGGADLPRLVRRRQRSRRELLSVI